MRDALFISGALLLALVAGPLSHVSAQAGAADPGDVYLVVSLGGRADLSSSVDTSGSRPLGPTEGLLGRFVIAPPDAHASLKKAGFLVLPASTLAAICGLSGTDRRP
jgi:hypothetical protein